MSKTFDSETYKEVSREYGTTSEFFRPQDGDNRIRVLSGYEPLAKHWIVVNGKSIPKICYGKEKGCQYHTDKKDQAKVQFLLWILDREDGLIKIYEAGWTFIKYLTDIKNDEDFGYESLPEYDIKIKKSGKDLATEYTFTPSPKKPLTDEEMNALMEKKDITEIVEKMKNNEMEKAGGSEGIQQYPEDEIKVEDIPY